MEPNAGDGRQAGSETHENMKPRSGKHNRWLDNDWTKKLGFNASYVNKGLRRRWREAEKQEEQGGSWANKTRCRAGVEEKKKSEMEQNPPQKHTEYLKGRYNDREVTAPWEQWLVGVTMSHQALWTNPPVKTAGRQTGTQHILWDQ